uniref:ZmEBE-2 protein, putative n=1 Tax=Oryza sativa subsp. japonica TaxID=39947 RepID=Q2QQL3_ORYSJ|nr:ZmEBE-2 protein, putative [Oryza sativa Japonica Group]
MATFDVYGFPNLNKDQVSSADLAVLNEQRHDLTDGNALFAGWMVDNGVSTGCYNLDRDGFVPVNNSPITPGDILEPTNGTLSITIKIFKKKDDGDWWLYFGHDNNNLSPKTRGLKDLLNSSAGPKLALECMSVSVDLIL